MCLVGLEFGVLGCEAGGDKVEKKKKVQVRVQAEDLGFYPKWRAIEG